MKNLQLLFRSVLVIGLLTYSFNLFAKLPKMYATLSHLKSSPQSHGSFNHKKKVWISFDYYIPPFHSVYIRAQPMTTRTSLSPGHVFETSNLMQANKSGRSGRMKLFFYIYTGDVVVRWVRVQIINSSKTRVFAQKFKPVKYCFPKPRHLISTIRFSPRSPASLNHKQYVNISFHYYSRICDAKTEKVYISVRPMTGNSRSRNYSAKGSGIHPAGSGSSTQKFTIKTGEVTVNRVKFKIMDKTKTKLLYQRIVPVNYLFPKMTSTDIRKMPD